MPERTEPKSLLYGGHEIPLRRSPDIRDVVTDIEEAIAAGGRMVRFQIRPKHWAFVYISADHPVIVMETPDPDASA